MNYPSITGVASDTVRRVCDTANELFDQNGGESIPSVDAVRRAAGVDMNAASLVMKEWRKLKLAQPARVEVRVPDSVQQAGQGFIVEVWRQAQEQANESLRAAQAAWDVEREELEQMRRELVSAFENLEIEHNTLKADLTTANATAEQQRLSIDELTHQLNKETRRAENAETRIDELQKRITDLNDQLAESKNIISEQHQDREELQRQHYHEQEQVRQELTQAQQQLLTIQAKFEAQQEAHNQQKQHAATELLREQERTLKLETQHTELSNQTQEANQKTALLTGKLETAQEQNEKLLVTIEKLKNN